MLGLVQDFALQGPLQVWVFCHYTCLEKLKYLIAEGMLQNYALFFFRYSLRPLLASHELMTTGTIGKTFSLEVFQVCFRVISYLRRKCNWNCIPVYDFSIFTWFHLAGLVVATFCYRQFFPNPYDDKGIHLFSFVLQDGFQVEFQIFYILQLVEFISIYQENFSRIVTLHSIYTRNNSQYDN